MNKINDEYEQNSEKIREQMLDEMSPNKLVERMKMDEYKNLVVKRKKFCDDKFKTRQDEYANEYNKNINPIMDEQIKHLFDKQSKEPPKVPNKLVEIQKQGAIIYQDYASCLNPPESTQMPQNEFNKVLKEFDEKFNKNNKKRLDSMQNIAENSKYGIINVESINRMLDRKRDDQNLDPISNPESLLQKIVPIISDGKKLKQHVPYILILDSCSSGMSAIFDKVIEGLPESSTLTVDQQEKLIKAQGELNKAVQLSLSTEIIVKLLRGDTFKEYGALFFSANPGDSGESIVLYGETANNEDKVGVLSRRFELTINSIKSSQTEEISLGKFLALFNDTKLDTQLETKYQKGFSWFSPAPDISNIIFIKNIQ